jgi:hypothetical protein
MWFWGTGALLTKPFVPSHSFEKLQASNPSEGRLPFIATDWTFCRFVWSLTSDILRSCPCEFRCSKPNSIDGFFKKQDMSIQFHTIPYSTTCTIQTALGYAKRNSGTSNFPETARMDTPKTEFDARKQQKLTKQLAPYWSFTTQLECGVWTAEPGCRCHAELVHFSRRLRWAQARGLIIHLYPFVSSGDMWGCAYCRWNMLEPYCGIDYWLFMADPRSIATFRVHSSNHR